METIIESIRDFTNKSYDEIEQLKIESKSMTEKENVREFLDIFWNVVIQRKERLA